MGEVRFSKYHGTGNDFVMIEDLEDAVRLTPGFVAAVCDRRFGIGADGLIRVAPSEAADFFMDYYNADGSVAEMCGNGIRCLGKLVRDGGLTGKSEIDVETRAGVKHLTLLGDEPVNSVTVGMGEPAFERSSIPMTGPADGRFQMGEIHAGGRSFTGSAVSMGNPHLVLFLEAGAGDEDVSDLGPLLEMHEWFPEKTNVEFVSHREGALHVRVWERGVGETMACGTGACAALVAANEAGLSPARGTVRFPGGALEVERTQGGEVLLTGPAVRVFDGTVDASLGGGRP